MTRKKTTKMMKKNPISHSEKHRLREMVPTLDELRLLDIRRDYRAIRARAFGNSIPPIEEVSVILLPKREMIRATGAEDSMGFTCAGLVGGKRVPFVIGIENDLGVVITRMTLIHEMAHLKVNLKYDRLMGHGKIWIAEMHRLVRIGEMDAWF